ncbi:MAG: L-threonylcarbamoyladenylate synthase [Gammaproteobacteria bacterium]
MADFAIRKALRVLSDGGLIAYPTEAVYGLGCRPDSAVAVMRLAALKQRDLREGFILIAADRSQLDPYLAPLTARIERRLRSGWPGPVTWVVPASDTAPAWITGGGGTIAVRVTAHPVAASLCEAFGAAIVSTSANRSGRPPARTALGVRRRFGKRIDAIVPGEVGGAARPSEIRDVLTNDILRP